jgi:hypothetical protein
MQKARDFLRDHGVGKWRGRHGKHAKRREASLQFHQHNIIVVSCCPTSTPPETYPQAFIEQIGLNCLIGSVGRLIDGY